ncbi:hypothetical protein [Paenibacillus naphthalenovorans]|uniref:hypothetical protein n=1 Tax=Paenibacillus naphthalenovorans TaxID=162209 RepID=UPI003D2871DD
MAELVGSQSIEFFSMYFLQEIFIPKPTNDARELAPVHYDIWNELEQMFVHDEWDKEEFILPRGCSKSTTINVALSCWAHCYKKSIYTIVLANRELDATEFVEKTKTALQFKQIVDTFGQLIDKRNRTVNKIELELANDTKIQAFSSGTSVRGTSYVSDRGIARPSLIILDDFTSEDDIITDSAKEKVLNKFYKEISEVGDSAVFRNGKKIKMASKFIVLGTPLSQDDFINTIRKDIDFKVFHRSVVDFDIDEYFDNHEHWQACKQILFNDKLEDSKKEAKQYYLNHVDEMKFPTIWEKYDCFDLAVKYFNKRIAFMQELMCNCENVGEKWFKSNIIKPKEYIESCSLEKTMLAIDTAGIKNKDTKRSDSFAFVVGSSATNGFKYVRKAELVKFGEFDKYIFHVIDLLNEFKDITHIFVEKNTYNGLDVDRIQTEINNDYQLKSRNLQIINEMQRKNKDEKISTIVSDVNNGRIIFCEERTQPEFLKQVMDFAGQQFSLFDDAPDCLAECMNRIDDIKNNNSFVVTIKNRRF